MNFHEDYNMNIYECRRYHDEDTFIEEWMGALVICAESKEAAEDIFTHKEDEKPKQTIEIKLNRGVIYNDEMR